VKMENNLAKSYKTTFFNFFWQNKLECFDFAFKNNI